VLRGISMKGFLCLVVTVILAAFGQPQALAKEEVIKRDTNEDGKIDQIAYFDKKGKLIKLAIDSNMGHGFTWQYRAKRFLCVARGCQQWVSVFLSKWRWLQKISRNAILHKC
jgi:hypothetical protein